MEKKPASPKAKETRDPMAEESGLPVTTNGDAKGGGEQSDLEKEKATLGKPRIYGHPVPAQDLLNAIGVSDNDAIVINDNHVNLIHVRVVEYQGKLHRVEGLCLILIGKHLTPVQFPDETVKEKDYWPPEAMHCWEFDLNRRLPIVRADAYVGSIFGALIEPEVETTYRAARGDWVGRGDLIGRGDFVDRGNGGGDRVSTMNRIHSGGRLLE